MSLPSGYKRLEYIQSSGTQYIDTGLTCASGFRTITDIEFTTLDTNFKTIVGAHNTGSPYARNLIGTQSGYFFAGVDAPYQLSKAVSASIRYSVEFSSVYPNVYCKVNEEQIWSSTISSPMLSSLNILILADQYNIANSNPLPCAKLYSCKIYNSDGTLVRDYIPCQKPDGTIGLWDDVNSMFYGNAGTGTFTAGPVLAIAVDASEITELEYIQSSGTQYIDTGFKQNQNSRVVMHVNPVSITANAWAFEGRTSSDCRKGVFFFYSSGRLWNADYYDSNGRKSFSGISSTADLSIDYDKNICTINGVSVSFTAKTFQSTANLVLLACNTAGTISGYLSAKLYSCQIYDNDALIRNYIAAKLSDGTVGLYDKENGLLYINVGTGTFTEGPEVQKSPPTPTGFAASALTDTTVKLSWMASDGATGYKLYRDGILIATLTDTSYTDTIQPFTSYIYTLTAYNDSGESDPATISVQVIIPPEAPSNFRAYSASMASISLAWDAVTGAESYQLSRDGAVIYTGSYQSYTDRGLTAETAYTYTLFAVNTAGSSAETTLEVATTQLILVTDRTAADVDAGNDKGTYKASDLNRVGSAMNDVADRLKAHGYDPHISPKTDWKDGEWVTPDDQAVYLGDLAELRKQFSLLYSTPEVPPRILATGINTNDGLTHTWANDIEKILEDIDLLLTNAAQAWFYSGDLFSGEV